MSEQRARYLTNGIQGQIETLHSFYVDFSAGLPAEVVESGRVEIDLDLFIAEVLRAMLGGAVPPLKLLVKFFGAGAGHRLYDAMGGNDGRTQ